MRLWEGWPRTQWKPAAPDYMQESRHSARESSLPQIGELPAKETLGQGGKYVTPQPLAKHAWTQKLSGIVSSTAYQKKTKLSKNSEEKVNIGAS